MHYALSDVDDVYISQQYSILFWCDGNIYILLLLPSPRFIIDEEVYHDDAYLSVRGGGYVSCIYLDIINDDTSTRSIHENTVFVVTTFKQCRRRIQ